jgi:integrase
MILLGINCAFGNTDVATLPLTALDLEKGWVNFPRPKTGVPRHSPLWPETVAAIRDVLAHRPEPKDPADAGLVFLTRRGTTWVRASGRGNALANAIGTVLCKLGINGRRGLGFYTLRHVYATVAGEAKDPVAVDHIMGHVAADMGARYREKIGDERLKAVSNYVRTWLRGASD